MDREFQAAMGLQGIVLIANLHGIMAGKRRM